MSRKITLGAAVAAAGALAVTGFAAPAQAADGRAYAYNSDWIQAAFISYWDQDTQDVFTVGDKATDGHTVRGQLLSGGGTVLRSMYIGAGKGDSDVFIYDIAKGKDT